MAFVLLAILIALAVAAYYFGGKDLLSPWFLLCLATLASFSIVVLNSVKWEVTIYPKFVLYLLTALCSFGFGCFLIKLAHPEAFSRKPKKLPIAEAVPAVKYPALLVAILSLLVTFGYIGKIFLMARGAIGGGSLTAIFRQLYEAKYEPGFLFNQMMEISVALAYVSIYQWFSRIARRGDRTSIFLLLVPIVDALLVCLFSTDRNKFLQFAIFFVILFMLFYRENTKREHPTRFIVLMVAMLGAVVVVLFFLLGKSKQYTSSFLDQISIYGGSGLYCFNLWLEDFQGPYLYGKSMFTTFLSIVEYLFGMLGIRLDLGTINQIDEAIGYTTSGGYYFFSNVYSAMRSYVEDFGYLGVLLVPFVLGLFYQWLYCRAKCRKYSYWWLLYALLIYPVIYFPILERLFRRLHFGFVYELVWPSLLYYLLLIRPRRKRTAKRGEPQICYRRGEKRENR